MLISKIMNESYISICYEKNPYTPNYMFQSLYFLQLRLMMKHFHNICPKHTHTCTQAYASDSIYFGRLLNESYSFIEGVYQRESPNISINIVLN